MNSHHALFSNKVYRYKPYAVTLFGVEIRFLLPKTCAIESFCETKMRPANSNTYFIGHIKGKLYAGMDGCRFHRAYALDFWMESRTSVTDDTIVIMMSESHCMKTGILLF